MIRLPVSRPGVVLAALALLPLTGSSAQGQRRSTPNDTLKSTEVAADHKVTFRIYAPKAERGLGLRRLRPGRQDGEGRPGRLVDDRRPADARLLQLHVQRRRRPHRGPEEPDDQAGTEQPRQPVPRAGRRGRVRDDQGRAARRRPRRLVSLRHARHAAPDARLHAPGYEGGTEKYPVLYLLHGGGRRGLGLEHDRPRRVHPRQPDRGQEGGADARGDAQRQPAAPVRTCPGPTPGDPPTPEARAAREAAQGRFTDELLKEVVPTIEKTFRVKAGPCGPGACGAVDGRRPDAAGIDHEPGPVRLRGGLEPGSSAGTPRSGRSGTRPSSPRPTRSTGRSSGSRSASATRTPWRPARRRWPGCWRSGGSSTRSTSAAAAIPGSTGGTTSASSPRSCFDNAGLGVRPESVLI